jgi:hypothetical protein
VDKSASKSLLANDEMDNVYKYERDMKEAGKRFEDGMICSL